MKNSVYDCFGIIVSLVLNNSKNLNHLISKLCLEINHLYQEQDDKNSQEFQLEMQEIFSLIIFTLE